jgi:hypothetical protein
MKSNNCTCINTNDHHSGKTIKDLKGIYENLNKIESDVKSWSSKFQCKICGQIWEEKYVQRGHGEVPEVNKINQKGKSS